MHHVHVGVSNSSTSDVVPDLTNYKLCGVIEGPVCTGGIVKIPCQQGTMGRHVIVQLEADNDNDALTLAEVEVYERRGE